MKKAALTHQITTTAVPVPALAREGPALRSLSHTVFVGSLRVEP